MRDQPESYVAAFRKLADLTAPKCAGCRSPFKCCSAANCEEARRFAEEVFGVKLEAVQSKIPFLGESGCVVAPHLRPLCTVHVCENHLNNPVFAEAYAVAREEAGEQLEGVLGSAG